MRKVVFFAAFLIVVLASNAQHITMNGKWGFALDPLERGEIMGWQKPWDVKDENKSLLPEGWDEVEVPHCWSLDNRYNFVGKAWYRKGFKMPSEIDKSNVRLHFDGVFYKCRIFLNGELVAYHEGGYTPFALDITKQAKYPETNYLALEVDNSWSVFTIPGARIGQAPNEQLYPWYEFGGITRDVSLEISSQVFISNQKIEALPNLENGTAQIKLITWVQNKSLRDTTITVSPTMVCRTNNKTVVPENQLSEQLTLPAWTEQKVVFETTLSAENTLLWDFDNPNLYDVESTISSSGAKINTYQTYFGIREFKSKNGQLLLNGNPVRLAGANRHSDHPKYGSTDPAELAKLDMELQRNGNMIFARLNHTPTSRHFFRWADENGYLIIAEVPNWQISPVLMAHPKVKEEFRMQAEEMIEAFWNSPSIVAYSTGNEYESWTPEGDAWTRYQMEKYRELDTTRLLTFISIGSAGQSKNLSQPYDSYRYCDFICVNVYGGKSQFETILDNLHQKYPGQALFISEFGMLSDRVKSEQERIDQLKDVIEVVKQRPHVAGFSYWSYNDYSSRFPGTNPSGYREWGIVDPNRKPRGLYKAFQTDLSPVLVKVENGMLTITAKPDFPSYTLKDYKVIVKSGKLVTEYPIPVLNPGESMSVKMAKPSASTSIVVESAGGFKVYDSGVL